MLDVKSKPVLLELSLDILSRRAVFTVYRSLYYYPRRSLVCGFGDCQVNVAIARVHASIFKKRVRYVDQLKFTTTARLINRKGDRVVGRLGEMLVPATAKRRVPMPIMTKPP